MLRAFAFPRMLAVSHQCYVGPLLRRTVIPGTKPIGTTYVRTSSCHWTEMLAQAATNLALPRYVSLLSVASLSRKTDSCSLLTTDVSLVFLIAFHTVR